MPYSHTPGHKHNRFVLLINVRKNDDPTIRGDTRAEFEFEDNEHASMFGWRNKHEIFRYNIEPAMCPWKLIYIVAKMNRFNYSSIIPVPNDWYNHHGDYVFSAERSSPSNMPEVSNMPEAPARKRARD